VLVSNKELPSIDNLNKEQLELLSIIILMPNIMGADKEPASIWAEDELISQYILWL